MTRLRVGFLVAFGVACCVAAPSVSAQPPAARDLPAMIESLALPPGVGSLGFSLGMSFPSNPLRQEYTDEQARAELPALRELADAGKATADDWAQLARLYGCLDQAEREKEAREEAAELYQARLAQEPEDVAALIGLGEQTMCSGALAEAEALLRKALTLDPDRLDAYPLMANALLPQCSPLIAHLQRALRERAPAALGYSEDELRALKQPGGLERLLAQLEDEFPTIADELAAIWDEPPTAEEILEAEAASRRTEMWRREALAHLHTLLLRQPTPEVFAVYVDVEQSVAAAMWMLALGRWRAQGEGNHAGFEAVAMQALRTLASDTELLAAGQIICERQPNLLRHRALVGSLQAWAMLSDLVRQMTEAGEAQSWRPPPERLQQSIQNLSAALALPADQRPGLAGGLASLHYFGADLQNAQRVAAQALDGGEWDNGLASVYALARLGIPLADLLGEGVDVGRLLEGETARQRLPDVEARLADWLSNMQPEQPDLYGTLASFRARLGNWQGALDALERAHALQSASVPYACGLGVAYLKLDRPADAATVLAAAVDMLGDQEDQGLARACHHAYGVALLALGRDDDAEDELDWQP